MLSRSSGALPKGLPITREAQALGTSRAEKELNTSPFMVSTNLQRLLRTLAHGLQIVPVRIPHHPMAHGSPGFGAATSPLGGAYMSPMGAAIHRNTSCLRPPLQNVEGDRNDWAINNNMPKNFNVFNGRINDYEVWANRIRDHLMMGNVGWGRLWD